MKERGMRPGKVMCQVKCRVSLLETIEQLYEITSSSHSMSVLAVSRVISKLIDAANETKSDKALVYYKLYNFLLIVQMHKINKGSTMKQIGIRYCIHKSTEIKYVPL